MEAWWFGQTQDIVVLPERTVGERKRSGKRVGTGGEVVVSCRSAHWCREVVLECAMWAGARSAASGRAQAKVACGRPDLIGPEVGQERGSLGHVWLSVGRGRRGSAGAFIVGMQWSCTCCFPYFKINFCFLLMFSTFF